MSRRKRSERTELAALLDDRNQTMATQSHWSFGYNEVASSINYAHLA